MIIPPGTPNPLAGLPPEEIEVPYVLLNKHSKAPTKGTDGAVGYDLYLNLATGENEIVRTFTLTAGEAVKFSVGVAFAIPDGYEGQIRPRSGLSTKGIIVANAPGTLDPDYRGPVIVVVHALQTYIFQHGERIAQVVFQRCPKIKLREVPFLDETVRGNRGFGSTGR